MEPFSIIPLPIDAQPFSTSEQSGYSISSELQRSRTCDYEPPTQPAATYVTE